MRTSEAPFVEQVAEACHRHDHHGAVRRTQPQSLGRVVGLFGKGLGALDALRRSVENPGEHHRDRKPDQQEDDDHRHGPFGHVQGGQDDGRTLGHGPGDGPVADRDLADATSFQFRQKCH
jgi:hypothetical protein